MTARLPRALPAAAVASEVLTLGRKTDSSDQIAVDHDRRIAELTAKLGELLEHRSLRRVA